jgi:hypothetical protein
MADNSSSRGGLMGVLIGALIVILVGGGILYATGALDPKPANVTVQPPATPPAPNAKDDDGRRGDWRDRDRDRDHNRDRDDRDGRDRDRR